MLEDEEIVGEETDGSEETAEVDPGVVGVSEGELHEVHETHLEAGEVVEGLAERDELFVDHEQVLVEEGLAAEGLESEFGAVDEGGVKRGEGAGLDAVADAVGLQGADGRVQDVLDLGLGEGLVEVAQEALVEDEGVAAGDAQFGVGLLLEVVLADADDLEDEAVLEVFREGEEAEVHVVEQEQQELVVQDARTPVLQDVAAQELHVRLCEFW